MIAAVLPLAQAAADDEATDWWRLLGLVAITLLTIVVLAFIFRPRGDQPDDQNGDGAIAEGDHRAETDIPGFGLGAPDVGPRAATPPAESELASERFRQIVNRVARSEGQPRRRLGERPDDMESPEMDEGEADEAQTLNGIDQMSTDDQSTISEQDAYQAGLDAEALEEQISRLFGLQRGPGKIVQFTPRKSASPADQDRAEQEPQAGRGPTRQEGGIMQFPVDLATREGITSTIQELLFCANVGELLHGFALYTDRYLFQFMDESRMSEDEFRETYSDIPAKDPSDWVRIDEISNFVRLEDGRIQVRVRYIDGSELDGVERFIMKHDTRLDRWLIDAIEAE